MKLIDSLPSERSHGSVSLLVDHARANPGTWFNITTEVSRTDSGVYRLLYNNAGRRFTPLEVRIREGDVFVRWGDV